jgi:anti-anti-sigma factor
MGIQEWSENILLVDLPQEPEMNEELKLLISQLDAEKKYHVAIDFSEVDIVTSSSIASLLKLRKLLVDESRRLVIFSICPTTKGILTVTGLKDHFEFADDKFVALATLNV